MGVTHIKGPGRKREIQRHRLDEFNRVFDDFLAGKASIDDVHGRADKLKQVRGRRK